MKAFETCPVCSSNLSRARSHGSINDGALQTTVLTRLSLHLSAAPTSNDEVPFAVPAQVPPSFGKRKALHVGSSLN